MYCGLLGWSCGQLYKESLGKLPPGLIFFSLKFPHGIAPVSHGKDKKIFQALRVFSLACSFPSQSFYLRVQVKESSIIHN